MDKSALNVGYARGMTCCGYFQGRHIDMLTLTVGKFGVTTISKKVLFHALRFCSAGLVEAGPS